MSEHSDLAAAFEDHRKESFPYGSQIERVSNLHAELAEYDGYVAGIVSSMLKGTRREVPPFDATWLAKIEEELLRHPEASDELVQYIKRAKRLRELLRLAQRLSVASSKG